MRLRNPSVLSWLLMGPLVVGLALATKHEATEAIADVERGRFNIVDACQWRWTSPPVAKLEAFLNQVTERLPLGTQALFVSVSGGAGEGREIRDVRCRLRWASYLASQIRLASPGTLGTSRAAYGIAYRTTLPREVWEPILTTPDGALYRRTP